MNYATIKYYDIANGPGVRVSLYVSGCRNHCKNCFNPETWSFEYGRPFTKEEEDKILKGMEPDYIKGFSLLGGDPFEPENQLALVDFMERLKRAYPNKSVWAYTGYDFEADLLTGKKGNPEVTMRLLRCIDVLVDGRFVEELKNPDLLFRGSSNQRIILVRQSLERDELVQMVAETDRTYLRGFVPGDADALYEILGDGQTMQYIEPAFDREKTVKFLNETCVGNKNAYVAVELKDSGRLIGYIMLKPCGERQLEAGWIFNKDYRGMGYACESVGAAFDHAFTELGAFSVTAGIDERNEASLKLARSLGMKFVTSERENGNTLLRYVKTKGNK